MIDNRTASAIDLALQKHHTPVGDLYVAIRHGRMKRCFSRGTAISWLAHFLTSHAFARSGFMQRHPDVQVVHPLKPELTHWQRGAVTLEYFNAHQRTVRRLRRILARKREMQNWCKKWDAMHDRYVKEREELKASKPAEVRNGSHSI
ncbi:TPA: hypothetical protein R7I90_003784 [Klebsiella pneumoniae]|uniref:hypothetical protein n=1 Tax=Klebsiella pneumoniae complex TaxID=3390273 RepID=UPI0007CA57A1|nr:MULTISPECIES: hypothetical protein [Klebsiella]HCB1082902.1 hypothetical protein [Klebsiella variicola subsp. variicola]MBS4952708.1 hypothetical protein [Klebsiella pneumoniae]MCZ9596401.1 hypothetical protein [Klebsiella quasipneumoniae]MDP0801610.1 hypothetical protein [Klebsiella variicola]SAS66943.1 Uncharacterised protein [Klebsiella pneumoniae]